MGSVPQPGSTASEVAVGFASCGAVVAAAFVGACVAGTAVVAGVHAPSSIPQITKGANKRILNFFMFISS
jgi:hypothetical protein